MLLFGALQIVVSQIPDFHSMAWLSVIAAIMSFTYSSIGFGLAFTKVIGKSMTFKLPAAAIYNDQNINVYFMVYWLAENGTIQGSITGVPASNMANKLWSALQALGDIAFAYPYTVILLEIQVCCPKSIRI